VTADVNVIQAAPSKDDVSTATTTNKPLKKVDNRDRNPAGGSVERIDRTLEDPIPDPPVVKQKVPTSIAKKSKKRPLVGEPEPLPSHVQVGPRKNRYS
jgi:hypothetical protein